jgi:hypothetical protein
MGSRQEETAQAHVLYKSFPIFTPGFDSIRVYYCMKII